jgi:hypothetical protein
VDGLPSPQQAQPAACAGPASVAGEVTCLPVVCCIDGSLPLLQILLRQPLVCAGGKVCALEPHELFGRRSRLPVKALQAG